MTLPVTYTTVSKVILTVPAIGSATSVLSEHIAAEAGKAEAVINARLAARYAVPFSTVPPVVEAIATDVTAYYVITKRLWASNRTVDEKMVMGLKDSFSLLDALEKGTMTLVESSGDLIAGRTDRAQISGTHMDYFQTFHEGHDFDQIQDPDKIESLYDERT